MRLDAGLAARSHYLEKDFFNDADDLRAQVEKACGGNSANGDGPLNRVNSGKAYSFFMATAERVFSHALVLSFLSRLRGWAMENLNARHVSTPQIHVYLNGCAREMARDATPANYHYLYSVTRAGPARLHILGGGEGKTWLGIGVSHLASVQLGFNNLLVHPTDLAYAVEEPREAKSALEGAVLFHGYIW